MKNWRFNKQHLFEIEIFCNILSYLILRNKSINFFLSLKSYLLPTLEWWLITVLKNILSSTSILHIYNNNIFIELQINILEWFPKKSRDTEDWSNGCWKFSFFTLKLIYIWLHEFTDSAFTSAKETHQLHQALQGTRASFTETSLRSHTQTLDHSRERSSPELSEINPAEAFGKRASASNKPRLILVICTTGCHHVPEETPRDLCAGINRNMEIFMKLNNNYGMSVNMFYKPNRVGQGVLFLLEGLRMF